MSRRLDWLRSSALYRHERWLRSDRLYRSCPWLRAYYMDRLRSWLRSSDVCRQLDWLRSPRMYRQTVWLTSYLRLIDGNANEFRRVASALDGLMDGAAAGALACEEIFDITRDGGSIAA